MMIGTDLDPAPGDPGPVQAPYSVIRVPGVFHLHEGEARGLSRHPDVLHAAVLGESVLQVVSNMNIASEI